MNFTPSPDQARGIDAVAAWFKDPHGPQSFTFSGGAGTGKTTCAQAFIEGMPSGSVVAVAPTGKAASVIAKSLEGMNVPCSTVHSRIYKPVELTLADLEAARSELAELKKRGLPTIEAKKRVERIKKKLEDGSCEFAYNENKKDNDGPAIRLILADECSMYGHKVEDDLRFYAESIGARILFMGDAGQLPSIDGTEFFERNKPDFVLDTPHRFAADSTINRLAWAVRRGEKFDDWNDTDCVSASPGDLDLLIDADQVITGKNATRWRLNKMMRKARGFGEEPKPFPKKGEKIICLRNDHGRGLINGVGGLAASDCEMNEYLELSMDLSIEGKLYEGLAIDPFAFELYTNPKLTRLDMPATPDSQFDLGHAITVHKAQGSGWDHVVVWDDKMRKFDKVARRRWIYTAVTRAAEKLTWISAG